MGRENTGYIAQYCRRSRHRASAIGFITSSSCAAHQTHCCWAGWAQSTLHSHIRITPPPAMLASTLGAARNEANRRRRVTANETNQCWPVCVSTSISAALLYYSPPVRSGPLCCSYPSIHPVSHYINLEVWY